MKILSLKQLTNKLLPHRHTPHLYSPPVITNALLLVFTPPTNTSFVALLPFSQPKLYLPKVIAPILIEDSRLSPMQWSQVQASLPQSTSIETLTRTNVKTLFPPAPPSLIRQCRQYRGFPKLLPRNTKIIIPSDAMDCKTLNAKYAKHVAVPENTIEGWK